MWYIVKRHFRDYQEVEMIVEMIAGLVPVVAGIGGVAASAAKGIAFVREGERALILRFEKARRHKNGEDIVVHPGFKMMIPWVDKLARIHVRQRVINLPAQTIVLSDRTVFGISAVITARVKDTSQDLHKALFETTGVDQALSDFGLTVIREVLTDKAFTDLFDSGRTKIDTALQQVLQQKANEWGIRVLSFQLSDCEPSDETTRMVQTQAAMQFKLEGLEQIATALGREVTTLPPALIAGMTGVQTVVTVPVVTEDGSTEQ